MSSVRIEYYYSTGHFDAIHRLIVTQLSVVVFPTAAGHGQLTLGWSCIVRSLRASQPRKLAPRNQTSCEFDVCRAYPGRVAVKPWIPLGVLMALTVATAVWSTSMSQTPQHAVAVSLPSFDCRHPDIANTVGVRGHHLQPMWIHIEHNTATESNHHARHTYRRTPDRLKCVRGWHPARVLHHVVPVEQLATCCCS